MKKYIRWLFLVAFLIFTVFIRETRMMTLNPNLFIVLWLIASFVAVLGVVYFRDDETTGENPADL